MGSIDHHLLRKGNDCSAQRRLLRYALPHNTVTGRIFLFRDKCLPFYHRLPEGSIEHSALRCMIIHIAGQPEIVVAGKEIDRTGEGDPPHGGFHLLPEKYICSKRRVIARRKYCLTVQGSYIRRT